MAPCMKVLLLVALLLDPESFVGNMLHCNIGDPTRSSAPDGFEGWCVDLLFHARHLFEANAKRQTPNAKFQLKTKAKPSQIFQKRSFTPETVNCLLCGACQVMMLNPRFVL